MSAKNYIIRKISKEDNLQMGKIIQSVILEMGAPKKGTAYSDPWVFKMFEKYETLKGDYFVIEEGENIIGGGGFAQLDNYNGNICELQKMYFLDTARGRGIGSELISKCLENAKQVGFDKCYLETMPYMIAAQQLYKKNGFANIDGPMGDTGHYSCSVWMLKDL